MNIEELTKLAEGGNIEAIISLGQYYLNNEKDRRKGIDEATKWFTKGAEKGSAMCMLLLSNTICMKTIILRKYNGSASPNYNEITALLNTAIYWANKAKEYGNESHETFDIIYGELGIAYYFLSLNSPNNNSSLDNLEKTISFLKPLYQTSNNEEILLYLGFALYDYNMLGRATAEEITLSHFLLKKCVDNYFDTLPSSAIASLYIGLMYTEGHGCTKNYDNAVYYIQKAHNAGHDCSQILSRFKKKIFGGYTFK